MSYDGPTDLYVDGEWTSAEGDATIESLDPATEEPYAEVARASEADVDRAVAAASEAVETGSEWREMAPGERAGVLRRMADAVESRKDEIVAVESRDNGKTRFEAGLDVGMVIDTLRYYAGWADKLGGSEIPVPGDRLNYTRREPVGVTAHVVPWNYPFQLAGRSLAPALACGNGVVLKPSSQTPCSALYYAEAAEAAGLPDGVLNVVPGTGSEAGAALAEHEGVDHLAFTGSTEIGTSVMGSAAEHLADVTLELGGKGPHVVAPDADLDEVVDGVHYGIFMNAGQMCWAGSRVVAHEDVHDELLDRLVERAESIPVGRDEGRMGPLVSESQRDEVQSYVQTGIDEGATLVTGGEVPENRETGYYLEPTIFADVDNDMTIAREEIFGPVLSVIEAGSTDEAIEIANDSPYGLLAGVWTTDLSTAHHAAERLDYGMVNVNEYPATFPQTPFGGTKRSGVGREQGEAALGEYTRVKNVTVNLG